MNPACRFWQQEIEAEGIRELETGQMLAEKRNMIWKGESEVQVRLFALIGATVFPEAGEQMRRLRLVFGDFSAWDCQGSWRIKADLEDRNYLPGKKERGWQDARNGAEIKKSLWKSGQIPKILKIKAENEGCLLYTSDAADEL